MGILICKIQEPHRRMLLPEPKREPPKELQQTAVLLWMEIRAMAKDLGRIKVASLYFSRLKLFSSNVSIIPPVVLKTSWLRYMLTISPPPQMTYIKVNEDVYYSSTVVWKSRVYIVESIIPVRYVKYSVIKMLGWDQKDPDSSPTETWSSQGAFGPLVLSLNLAYFAGLLLWK